jgi:tyrosine-protein kinase Etk/Wzc
MAAHVNGGGDGMLNANGQRDVPRVPGGAGEANTVRATPNQGAPANARSEPTSAELIWILVERRWSVIGVTAAALALSLAYLLATPPTYESSVLIQVEGRSRPVTAFEDLAVLFQESTPTEGEMRIMRSRTLIDAVVEQLGLDVEVRPRTLPVVGGAFARRHEGATPAPALLGLERFAWGGERMAVQRLSVTGALVGKPLVVGVLGGGRYRIATSDGAVLGEGEVGEPLTGGDGDRRFELLVSELTARPETEFILEKRRRIDAVEDVQRSLRITEQGRHTGLVEVALAGHDPARIAAILDAVSSNYRRQSIERTSAEAARTLAVLEAQLPVLKRNLEKAERSLNAFHRRNGTANLSLGGERLLERLGEIDRTLAENDLRRAELSNRSGRHPEVAVLEERGRRLDAQRTAMEARLRDLPQLELESTRLTRELRVATDLYILVLNRAEELRIVRSGWIGNVRLLEQAAVPNKPSSPRRGVVLALGTILGLAGGLALALGRNAFDRGARDPLEIESGAGLAMLATIPYSAQQRRLDRRARRGRLSALSMARPGDAATEDLRSLRTSVEFALRGARNKIVGISGLAPKAGKSFVSVNLAHLLAATDGRVLLVDGDLRRGGLHRYFGLEAGPGLADVLRGGLPVEAALRPTDTPNLDLLPAGTAASPSELLASERFKQLLMELGQRYGVVVVDTPPILSCSDFTLVGRHAGVNLLVIRPGEHSVGEISYVLKRLVQQGVAVKGGVLNGVRLSMGRYGEGGRYRGYQAGPA